MHHTTKGSTRSLFWSICALLLTLTLGHAAPAPGWVAYNDSAYKPGQVNADNVTTLGLGANFVGEGTNGNLKIQKTGTDTGVTVQFIEVISSGNVNSASDAATYAVGSDAEKLFNGMVDIAGNMSYGNAPGWYVDLKITGLDPKRRYTFYGTANRNGGDGYADRVTNWKIIGADSFTYASSAAAQKITDDSVEFSTGNNTNGLVAGWKNISPGRDGTVTIRTTHSVGAANGGVPGAHAYKGYAGGVFLLAMQPEEWEAYNDSAFKTGQINADNVTTFGVGRNFTGEATAGDLKNLVDGENTQANVAYVETISTGSVNNAGDFADYAAGTDAEAVFKGKVDLAGNISYGDSPGWYVDLKITGLDPTRFYTFVGTANRNGGAGYADRVTNWKLIGADFFTYASSAGAHKVSDDSVEFSTGENGAGYVARWTDIKPGSDGTIIIRTSHTVGAANGGLAGAHAYKGYGGGVFMVKQQLDTSFRWQAFNDSAYKSGQVNAANATTIGIGRSFTGDTNSAHLKRLADGTDSGINAEYTETISTGSVNNAGDAADYTVGTDAADVFKGIVDLAGNISYGDSPGWHIDLTFTGLNPAKQYSFVGTANRNGGAGYADRVTNWRIVGADAYSYASTPGTFKISDDSVEFSTGENGAGYVARWNDINPGADGKIIIRTTHSIGLANGGMPGAHAYKGYGGGVFMLAEQIASSGGSGKPVEIFSVAPGEGAANVHPNSPIQVVLKNGDRKVNLASLRLTVDGAAVQPVVVTNGTSITVTFQPAMFASSSTHTAKITFSDDAAVAGSYSREWSFTAMDYAAYPTLPASQALALDPAKYQQRGFALSVIAPDPNEGYSLFSVADALGILANPPQTTNLANPALRNSLGYYIENDTINYQIDGRAIGNKANDRKFPGISSSTEPGNMFVLEARTLLHLKPGYYHFNITMQQGFALYAGTGLDEIPVDFLFTQCTGCGGDDAPWSTDFLVGKEGLYPFRLVFFNEGGGASLEWLNINPLNIRYLMNENDPGAIEAFVPTDAIPLLPKVQVARGQSGVVVTWQNGSVLQQADTVTGPWTDVVGAANPYTVSGPGPIKFFRVRQ